MQTVCAAVIILNKERRFGAGLMPRSASAGHRQTVESSNRGSDPIGRRGGRRGPNSGGGGPSGGQSTQEQAVLDGDGALLGIWCFRRGLLSLKRVPSGLVRALTAACCRTPLRRSTSTTTARPARVPLASRRLSPSCILCVSCCRRFASAGFLRL